MQPGHGQSHPFWLHHSWSKPGRGYEYHALQTLTEIQYRNWRLFDPEDTFGGSSRNFVASVKHFGRTGSRALRVRRRIVREVSEQRRQSERLQQRFI